jgi:hypothetical protein
MDKRRDYFKKIDFDKPWDEEDWERFFRAQEQLVREPSGPSFGLPSRKPGLSFRDVLRRFGMDPDNPGALPAEFDPLAEPEPSLARPFWQEDAELESLPIYCQAKRYAARVLLLCDRHFVKLLNKPYKSAIHRRCQAILRELIERAADVPRDVACGHHLGYGRDGVKGNIARCKRALAHADACVGLVTRFPRRKFPAGEYGRLVKDTFRLRHDLAGWIAFLRRRFS